MTTEAATYDDLEHVCANPECSASTASGGYCPECGTYRPSGKKNRGSAFGMRTRDCVENMQTHYGFRLKVGFAMAEGGDGGDLQ